MIKSQSIAKLNITKQVCQLSNTAMTAGEKAKLLIIKSTLGQ